MLCGSTTRHSSQGKLFLHSQPNPQQEQSCVAWEGLSQSFWPRWWLRGTNHTVHVLRKDILLSMPGRCAQVSCIGHNYVMRQLPHHLGYLLGLGSAWCLSNPPQHKTRLWAQGPVQEEGGDPWGCHPGTVSVAITMGTAFFQRLCLPKSTKN